MKNHAAVSLEERCTTSPHVLQPAPTARSKCRGCGERIAAGDIRFGESLPNPFGEGDVTHWYHPRCGAYKRPAAFLEALPAADAAGAAAGAEDLEAAAREGIAHRRVPRINGAERDPSGRAHCRACKDTIAKGTWRISLVYFEEGRFVPSGSIHAGCAQQYFETTGILARVRHFSPQLGEAELAEIQAAMLPPATGG